MACITLAVQCQRVQAVIIPGERAQIVFEYFALDATISSRRRGASFRCNKSGIVPLPEPHHRTIGVGRKVHQPCLHHNELVCGAPPAPPRQDYDQRHQCHGGCQANDQLIQLRFPTNSVPDIITNSFPARNSQMVRGAASRNSAAFSSARVSLRNSPVPDSIPAMYLSFIRLRWIGKNST